MRTVIYARFSSALQNSRSIEDQVSICRERASREGWSVVDVFTDYAISGAAGIDADARPGLNALLDRVEAGGVDQVLAEATDRIARHQGDAFAIRERLTYAGARLFTLADGEVTEITATFRGLMDAQFRKDLGAKIKRGQRGTVAQGRSPAGLAYGYRKAPRLDDKGELIRGLREIDDDQADVVRRIFREYVAGLSPRAIADRLNSDGIPGPTGGIWRASTITGDRVRKNGMLQNQLYVGRIVHNRTSKVVEPKTRAQRIRANPEGAWLQHDVPALRIIDDELWNAAQAIRQRNDGVRPEKQRRPKHMLSGLAVCGICGGRWSITRPKRWGCNRHREGGSGGCSNNRSILTSVMEGRVLHGLQDQMLDPALIEIYVREYHLDYARRAKELARESDKLKRRHADAVAKVERLVEAVANGADEFVEIRAVLSKARAERDALATALEQIDQLPVVALHPAVIADYRAQVSKLNAALAENPEARLEAIPRLRALIDQITVWPDTSKQRGVIIEVTGRLQSMLALATGRSGPGGNGGGGSGSMYGNDGAGRANPALPSFLKVAV